MALDDAQKRYSSMNMMCPWRVTSLPFPDADLDDVGDRQQFMLLCTAQEAVTSTPSVSGVKDCSDVWLLYLHQEFESPADKP